MKIDWKKEIRMPRPSLSWLRSLFSRLRDMLNRGPSIDIGRPSLRGSSIKGPSLKRPKALSKGPEIRMPRVVTDLYADLRDRHLLPVVVLLIAAIVAAPILLGNKGEKKEPTAVAPIAGEEGAAAGDSSFTVVPAARDLRSPSKRLGHRQALDPFRIDKEAAAANSSEPSEAGGGSKASSTGAGEEAAGGSSSSSGGGTTTSTTETTVVESSPSTPEQTTTPGNVTVQVDVTGYTAVIKAGDVPGEPAEQREVAPMAKLPSKNEPLVVFTALTPDDKRALLLMTSRVTGYYGDGHCTVDKQACQMLELQVGKSATFSYLSGGEEKRYKVVLEKIQPVLSKAEVSSTEAVKKKSNEKPAERGSAVAQARSFSK